MADSIIVTSTTLGQYPLLLLAHLNQQGMAKLVETSWLVKGQSWRDSKSSHKLKKHYKLSKDDFVFIDKNSLSNNNPSHTVLLDSISQLESYICGKRSTFNLPLDLSIGTPFQQQVWQALQEIPFGETISYAQLAQRVHNPKAYRAVAQANGKNPFSVIIPCHRVIASGGQLGGYTGGIDKKEYLLGLEGVKCRR